MGYVPQDVMLFFGSVKDNILMGAQHADDADILSAADLSGASEFVNRHPLGFDLPVGERGDNLSGGQRQSIAIARALVNDPPFLLMDEPTNSMDHTSEERLKKNLKDYVKNKTLVLVTHRASLLELVDRLIVMDSGRVMADGPKDQVLQSLRDGSLRGG
jgi:ATP-binding cassette subfamily C protein LapB